MNYLMLYVVTKMSNGLYGKFSVGAYVSHGKKRVNIELDN